MANPFEDKKKEAAKRALMAALEGKADVLKENELKAAALRKASGGGGGRGGRGGGSGGGGGGGDDGKWKKEACTTFQTFAIIVGGLVLFNTWRQLLALFVNLIFAIFRISPTGPGGLEPVDANASAIDNVSRWASEDEDEGASAQEKKS